MKKQTPFQKAGYKPDDVFMVIGVWADLPMGGLGHIFMLYKDDGSYMPKFRGMEDEFGSSLWWIELNDIEKIGTI